MSSGRLPTSWLCATGLFLVFLGAQTCAENAPAPKAKGPSFDSYRLVVDRNIFSSARGRGATPAADDNKGPDPARTIRLLGTWIDGSREIALFEGAGISPRDPLTRGGQVAGYEISDIRPDAVILKNAQGTATIAVGGGLTKGDDGAWSAVQTLPRSEATVSKNANKKTNDDTGERPRRRRRKEPGS